MQTYKTEKMPKNDGSYLEQLVQMIEKSISPDAVVEQNVKLPVIDSPSGATRQCDIVIRSGPKHREALTIIEVQDRNRPVEINDFCGWIEKLNDIGAQHLYCVSAQDFPQSIKEKAARQTNKIKLITIRESTNTEIPLNFFRTTLAYVDNDVQHIKIDALLVNPLELKKAGINRMELERDMRGLKTNDFKFSTDQILPTSLSTLCIQNTPDGPDTIKTISKLKLGYHGQQPLFYIYKGKFINISLTITYTWSRKKIEIPILTLSYTQLNHGPLAWVLEGFYESNRGRLWVQIPVTQTDEKEFLITGMQVSFPVTTDFSFWIQRNIRE